MLVVQGLGVHDLGFRGSRVEGLKVQDSRWVYSPSQTPGRIQKVEPPNSTLHYSYYWVILRNPEGDLYFGSSHESGL